MAYSLYKQAVFTTGLATVGYALYNPNGTLNTARTTSGVAERDATGVYGATVSFPVLPLEIRWDNGSGTYFSEAVNDSPDLTTDLVWDESLTASTHNVGNSAGKRLRQLSAQFIYSGTAQGGGNNYITLDTGASSQDDTYDPSLIFIDTGTGAGQSREIYQYDGSTRRAWVNRNWRTNPDSNSTFQIYSFSGDGHVNEGPCSGATHNTISLNRGASSTDNVYNGQVIAIFSGTGDDQAARILSYDGATKTATIDRDWVITPLANDSVYAIYPTAQMSGLYLADGVWDATMTDHIDVGSTGAKLNAAAASGDPLSANVPGAYASGEAGYVLGHLNDNSVTVVAAVQSGEINAYQSSTWSFPIVVGNISGNTKLWFTVKRNATDSDGSSLVQIEKTAGLVTLNSSSLVTASDGSIVVNNATTGDITITLKPSSSSQVQPGVGYSYDVKTLISGVVTTLADGRGKFNLLPGVTKAYS